MESGLKRQKWSAEEDEKLIRYVKEHEAVGKWSWSSVPEKTGLLRSAKSCNSRYNDYLKVRDDLKGGKFTRKEEETIVRLHRTFGNSWATIAKYLPGRSKIEIKNYWKHNVMDRVPWIIKNDSTSNALELPNLDNNKGNQEKNESSTSTTRTAVGEEVALPSPNLEWFDFGEVDMINNNPSGNGNLSSSSGTGGEMFAWSPTDFELFDYAEKTISNGILANDSNLSSSGTGGEMFAWSPTNFELFDYEEKAISNGIIANDSNLNSSIGTGGEMFAWSPTDFELFDYGENAISNGILANDSNLIYGIDGEVSIPGEELAYDADFNWFGYEDGAILNNSLIDEGYVMGPMEMADPVPSDIPQGDMGAEMVPITDEILNNLMGDLQDDGVEGQDADELDSVYAMFSGYL